MQPEGWRRIQDIFDGARKLEPEERSRFLERECGDDAILLAECTSLLSAYDAAPSYLDAPAVDILSTIDPELEGEADPVALHPLVGSRLGSFRIVQSLGDGGMGSVYLGVRDDDQYRQEVAIKILKHELNTGPLRQRFRQERQILAGLDHPSVTRLLDGGVAADGRPYIVMEKVDGAPIDQYCREHCLSLRARLELFLAVCDTVGYAHRNLVVHRDLKPNNVLVEADGRVKLLDFGIAKLLGETSASDSVAHTQADWRLLTPEYASPEQLRGELVTTASDVFALGLLLFELLSGVHPFRRPGMTTQEVARAISTAAPDRPSTGSELAPRQLRGDLDTIVLKALQKEPERRYSSVEALSEDLRRHLRGEPVLARGESVVYRMTKFARRHWAALTTAATLFALLIGFVLALGAQNRRISGQAHTIELERDRAEKVMAILVDMFAMSDPFSEEVRADTLRVRDFLRLHTTRLVDELADQPDLQAQVAHLLGQLHGNVGLLDEALPLVGQGLELRRRLYGDGRPEVAQSLDYMGTLYQARGDFETAILYFEESLSLRRKLFEPPHPEIAESLNNFGLALLDADRRDAAGTLLRESLEMRRLLSGDRSTDVAQSLNTLAVLNYRNGELQTAEDYYRQALEIRREALGPVHPYVANLLNNLARCVEDQGRLDEADALLREALRVWEKTLGPEHPTVSAGHYNLGRLAGRRGDHSQAIALLQRSNAQDRRSYPPDHPYVADSSLALGKELLSVGRATEAESLLREAGTAYAERKGSADPETVKARGLLVDCLIRLHRFTEAETTLLATLTELTDAGGERSEQEDQIRAQLSSLYTAWDRPEPASFPRRTP